MSELSWEPDVYIVWDDILEHLTAECGDPYDVYT